MGLHHHGQPCTPGLQHRSLRKTHRQQLAPTLYNTRKATRVGSTPLKPTPMKSNVPLLGIIVMIVTIVIVFFLLPRLPSITLRL